MTTTIEAIQTIAEREGFTPTGLFDYCRDILRYPDKHIADIEQELFADHPQLKLEHITRQLSLEAEGIRAPEPPGIMLLGHRIEAVIRWMGGEGWTYHEAKQALAGCGHIMDKQLVLTEMANGEDGYQVPRLHESQMNSLYRFLDS